MTFKPLVIGIIFSIISFYSGALNAQKKNIVHGSAGSAILINSASINYERLFYDYEDSKLRKIYFKLSYGIYSRSYVDYGQTWNFYSMSLPFLIGKEKVFFEITPGLSFRSGASAVDAAIPDSDLIGIISFALRTEYENTMFRWGAGNQEVLFVCFGYRF